MILTSPTQRAVLGRRTGIDAYVNSAFSPTQIAGLQLWLDASVIAGSNNDPVMTWLDQSGQGHNASQSNPAFQPVLKTNIVNSKPVVRFDAASTQFLEITYAQPRPQSLFMVYQTDPANIGRTTAGTTTAGAENWLFGSHSSGVRWWFANGAVGAASGSFSTFYCLSGIGTALDSTLYSNGVQLANSAAIGVWGAVLNLGGAGGAENFTGDIAELIIYDTALSAADQQRVEAYLMSKYGL